MGALSAAASADGNRVASVDSLRCFAMTAVMAQHCGLMPFGWTGVWLFFVISGFVVTLTVIEREVRDRTPSERLRNFFLRRTLRIAPVYYAYIGVGILACIIAGYYPDPFAILSLFGFFHNIAMAMGRGEMQGWPVGHLWTISVEMQFYLVYGILLVLAQKRAVIVLLLAALLVAPSLRFFASSGITRLHVGSESSAYWIYSGSFLHMDSFAMGGLLAFASHYGRLRQLARPLAWAGAAAMLAYAIVYMWLNHSVRRAEGVDILKNIVSGILWGQYREVVFYSALALVSGGLVALAATRDRSVDWLLRERLFCRIGEISYGAYIFHAAAINAAAALLSWVVDLSGQTVVRRVLIFALAYVMTIITAELSFRYFESRFSTGRKGRAGAVRAVPFVRVGHPQKGELPS